MKVVELSLNSKKRFAVKTVSGRYVDMETPSNTWLKNSSYFSSCLTTKEKACSYLSFQEEEKEVTDCHTCLKARKVFGKFASFLTGIFFGVILTIVFLFTVV